MARSLALSSGKETSPPPGALGESLTFKRLWTQPGRPIGLLKGDMKFGFCFVAGSQFLGAYFLLFRIQYSSCVIVKTGVYECFLCSVVLATYPLF
jgi:hypothetical protein